MDPLTTVETPLPETTAAYVFPATPFESIGFALSGGGFRAASYGLGVLSLLNEINVLPVGENKEAEPLLRKVRFVSSASGGTITLIRYAAAIRKGVAFHTFFRQFNEQLKGETVLAKAVDNLDNDQLWTRGAKSRNLINAFAVAYHDVLFASFEEQEKTLGFIMDAEASPATAHIEEFCFNASEFYTGISFRFQGAEAWQPNRGGQFGNSNIRMDKKEWAGAAVALKKIRLADILAASSCFPLGFEPIMYPRDFAYPNGASVKELKDAIVLDTYSWKDDDAVELNQKSRRAQIEKEFADKKEFGLMDGGICDNQGLYSLLEANKRKDARRPKDEDPYNRFDLMMVSDVTSFYMTPYKEPTLSLKGNWAQRTPIYYWEKIKALRTGLLKWLSWSYVLAGIVAVLFALPLVLDAVSIASVALSIVGLLPLTGVWIVNRQVKTFINKNPKLDQALQQPSLQDLYQQFFTEDNFTNRIAAKVIQYLQRTPVQVLALMGLTRAQSAATMIGEVFLKHIRRLIYDKLFSDEAYQYRRLDNPIYRLSYTNRKNRRLPAFDAQEDETAESYKKRKQDFVEEVNASCKLTDEMQRIAELAYNAGTTLWFTNEEENQPDNLRKAIIATGQFSTCYSLLRYTLSLKHSRHFSTLGVSAQKRVEDILAQLKALMIRFETNPYFLYEERA